MPLSHGRRADTSSEVVNFEMLYVPPAITQRILEEDGNFRHSCVEVEINKVEGYTTASRLRRSLSECSFSKSLSKQVPPGLSPTAYPTK